MRTYLLRFAVSTSAVLLAFGCGRSLGLDAGGSEGGGGNSMAGSGGQGNGQYGGMSSSSGVGGVLSGGLGGSGSGGQAFGGMTGLGGSELQCGCDCPAIGPCPCSICDGTDSGTGGAISSSGGVVSYGGVSGSSGRGGVGGASGSGGSSVICFLPPCAPPSCPGSYVVAPSNDCDCSGPCGCPCGCWTCVPVSESPDASTRKDASVSDGPSTAGGAKIPLQHRSTSVSCPSQRGPGPSCTGTMCSSCSTDSQCTAGVNGRCFPWEGQVSRGGCSYDECSSDSNCGAKTPCLCRSSSTDNSANMCDVGGNCAVDSDCGPGGYCSPSMETCYSTNPEAMVEGRNYGGPNPYYCHTASDLCTNDSDCALLDAGTATTSPLAYTPCAYNVQDERWECTHFVCGLP